MRGAGQRVLLYIPTLHPHIESLNSIKVFAFRCQGLSINHSFLDLIVLDNIFNYGESGPKLKTCFFKDSELMEINPIYESFKRIKVIDFYDYKGAFAKLNILKQASIQEIENIIFLKMNEEDFEKIINLLLNYKINTLKYFEEDIWESISNQALENISKINPQKLHQLILNS